MGIMMVLFIGFLILPIVLLVQVGLVINGKFKYKAKNISTSILGFVLLISFFFPYGVVDSSTFEEPNIIWAQYEGVANCTETLKMKKDSRFSHSSICFGVEEYEGTYKIIGDTIKMKYEGKVPFQSKFAYGIIDLDSNNLNKNKGKLLYHRDLGDANPLPMIIGQYKL